MEGATSYRSYWFVWVVLLILTLFMIAVEASGLARAAAVLILAGAMLTKATLIAGWFMHLRYERMALVACVAVGILATAAFLFFLIATDGVSMARLAA
ncbi:MAG: cytochrome C oxidase subunit IV family protein [Gemmatimonadota bacterium]